MPLTNEYFVINKINKINNTIHNVYVLIKIKN